MAELPRKVLLTVCLALFPFVATAQFSHPPGSAADCLKKSQDDKSQYLTNSCTQDIVVVWCHDRDVKGWRDGLCGTAKGFYRLSAVLEANGSLGNPYSTPLHQKITYGACFGGYAALRKHENGAYSCSTPNDILTVSTRGSTREAACDDARAQGATQGLAVTSCECKSNAKAAICRVNFAIHAPDPDRRRQLIDWVRKTFPSSGSTGAGRAGPPRS